MDDVTEFERRFEDRLRTFALTGVQPVDSAAVAHDVAVRQPRQRGAASSMPWNGLGFDRRVLTIALFIGLLVALLGGALLAARLVDLSPTISNGWIAFTTWQSASGGADDDFDIWLVAFDKSPHRAVGSETDRVQQLCPAFSPDGRSLAYGRVEGHATEYSVNADGTEVADPPRYRQAALVVADVSDDGEVSDRLTIDVGDGLPPPCPVWSPDGDQVAFGVNRTPPVNPETSAAGSEVWVVTLADQAITVLPDLLASDLDWSPDGDTLAIASGEQERAQGEMLNDGRILLYAPGTGAMQSLDGTVGAAYLTWSPDGRRIAFATAERQRVTDPPQQLRTIDVATGRQEILADDYEANHGIGPVWSPDGETIAYQRLCETVPRTTAPCREQHEVVLVTPGDSTGRGAIPDQVLPFQKVTPDSDRFLFPFRVTWSPDGEYLLYQAWGASSFGNALVAIPADLDGQPIVVADFEGIFPHDGNPDTTLVPIQTWGRSPAD